MQHPCDDTEHHVNMEQRRTSNASDTATLQDGGRPVLSTQESVEFIPTRGSKVTPPKPAANPLQFIKVGPCDLYKTAQEQIKKVEEVKKIKAEVREDAEDWQSNLDNWKCGRRKRQEHIIERVVEVKKLELEEHDRNRRRSKTFNEMMEDRNVRGRKTSLMVYKDDEANDLSDLGIGTSSGDDNQSLSDRDELHNLVDERLDEFDAKPSETKEEYTYDLAIQTYVNFAEKARNNVNETLEPEKKKTQPPQLPFKPRRESAPKIEEKIAFLDERRRSSTELNSAGDKAKLVKVDVLKRRELFERGDQEEAKFPGKVTSPNVKVSGSIKDRLTSLEQQKSCEKINAKEDIMLKRLSNGDMSPPQSVKERLSSLQNQVTVEQKPVDKAGIEVSIKERVDNLDASVNKRGPEFETKFAGSERSSSPEDEIYATKRTQFHRSLDSLDRDEDLVNGGFDRVQSLEDIDCLGVRHYPPSASSTEMLVFSSQSGDTDREDSGIHTANVSSSVSQADEDADLDVEVVNHRRQLSEQSEQLSPLPPIQEIDAVVVSRGDDKSESDDDPVEAVIAQRCSETIMLATREATSTPPDLTTSVEHVEEVVKLEANLAPVDSVEEELTVPSVEAEILSLTLDGEVEMLSGELMFPLGPTSSAEPPKEKPPPPPTDLSDEETTPTKPAAATTTSLRRVDSTKRIKKEIRRKRSDFLGIEGNVDDSYLETVLSVAPDMTAFLLEEQRQQKQLYRQSICSESDSNPGESRDSGVELEMRGRPDDHQPLLDLSAQHSRQESEIYGNGSSVTSEEDEIAKKEREIIEMLEKEEQWRYATNANEVDLGEKLAEKLRQLEQEKLRLEWERREEEGRRIADENARREETMRLRAKEQELREQETTYSDEGRSVSKATNIGDGNNSGEVIRVERERLMAEQEELVSQRENLIMRETQQLHEHQLREQQHREQQLRDQKLREQQHLREQQSLRQQAMSMQDVSCNGSNYRYEELPPTVPPSPLNYHLSMPELAESTNPIPRSHRAPPPVPPAKPVRSQDQRERSIVNSRVASADYIQQDPRSNQSQQREETAPTRSQIPRDQDAVPLRRPNNEMRAPLKPDNARHSTGSQMSRQTLQALSAAPRSRIVSTDNWIQAKRKPDTSGSCNYQHWLIQEAEHRRITEMNQRQRDKPLPDAIINTLTQRVQNRAAQSSPQRRQNNSPARNSAPILKGGPIGKNTTPMNNTPIMVNTVVVNNNVPAMNKSPIRSGPMNNGPTNGQAVNNGPMMNRASNGPSANHSPMSNSPKMAHITMNGQPMNNGQPMGNGQHSNGQLMGNGQYNGQPMSNGQYNGQHSGQPMGNGHAMNGQLSVQPGLSLQESQEKMLSVSGKKKCSHCSDELGRGAAMIIESLRLFYHIECFKCCVCHVQLGDGLMGTDVRVRNNKLHCHNCYSSDDGVKFSCV